MIYFVAYSVAYSGPDVHVFLSLSVSRVYLRLLLEARSVDSHKPKCD